MAQYAVQVTPTKAVDADQQYLIDCFLGEIANKSA